MKQNRAAAELIPGASRRVLIDLTKLGETIRQMRDENLDVLFDFSSWQRLTAFYSMMSGARFTVGFQTAGQYRGRGYDARVEHRSDLHEVDNFRALIASVGISGGSAPKVNIPAISYEPLSEIGDVVVFHLWASGQRSWLREWPEERWIALAKVLARRDTVFVTTGAPSDLDRIGPFVERLRSEGHFSSCADTRAGSSERKYWSDAFSCGGGCTDCFDQRAEQEWSLGSGRFAGHWG
jgi:ADP-heptose:LPS heptosyltransferase